MATVMTRYQSEHPECTQECRSPNHAYHVTCAVTKGSEEEVVAYLRWLCRNYTRLIDAHGRTVLHSLASCGRWQALRWILQRNVMDVNIRDRESGWTPLHRSLFYGQLTTAKILIEAGASVSILDHDCLSPLDLAMKDVPLHVEYKCGLYEAYVWGDNQSYNLGLGSDQARATPEILENFNPARVSVSQAEMCEFHSIFLLSSGQAFTCGQGQGGRLGLRNSERIVLIPQLVSALGKNTCVVRVAAALDHSIFLTATGDVWSCGSNFYHQLGHVPPPDKLLEPAQIDGRAFKGYQITGVCAARYHTVAFASNAIFTFGLNAGQLGFADIGDRRQTVPRKVTAFPAIDNHFTHVTASEGATICVTSKGDIFVLHEFQCRKIASKQLDIATVKAVGGTLDTKADKTLAAVGSELKVILLTKCGRLHIWTSKSCPQMTRCLLSLDRHIVVTDVAFSNVGVVLSTRDGEGFTGKLHLPKSKSRKADDTFAPTSIGRYHANKQMVKSFANWLDRDECAQIALQRLSHVHRATNVFCDVMGKNFAVLQANPRCGMFEVPQPAASQMNNHLDRLLKEANVNDCIHDAVINVGNVKFPVHQYILAQRCEYFRSQIIQSRQSAANKRDYNNFESQPLSLDCPPNTRPEILEQLIQYLYTDSCDLLVAGRSLTLSSPMPWSSCGGHQPDVVASSMTNVVKTVRTRRSPRANNRRKDETASTANAKSPVRLLRDTARAMGVNSLEKRLECVEYIDDKVVLLQTLPTGQLKFDRHKDSQLSDVLIRTSNGSEFKCHKCILVAGSEYFYSMLVSGWLETSSSSSLMLSIPGDILEIVIECLYTEDSPKLRACKDTDLVCNVLVTADQLLMTCLKDLCEVVLTDLLTLRNAFEFIEMSRVFDAPQLRKCCMHFICLNVAAFLETKSLNLMSDQHLIELTSKYKDLIPQMCYRAMTPHSGGPTKDDLTMISQLYPVDLSDSDLESDALGTIEMPTRDSKKGKRKKVKNAPALASPYIIGNTTGRKRNESACSVASDTSEKTTVALGPKVSSEPIFFKSVEGGHSLRSTTASPTSPGPDSPFSSPPVRLWQNVEVMESAFPDLVVDLKSPPQHSRKIFGAMPRLSQEQQQKVAASSFEPEVKSPKAPPPITNAAFMEREAKLANPWGTPSSAPLLVSLSDIMKAANVNTARKLTRLSSGRKLQTKPVPIPPSPKATTIDASIVSPSPPRNPWGKIAESCPEDSSETVANLAIELANVAVGAEARRNASGRRLPSFNDIVKLEQEQNEHIARQHSKSLSMIQIEDKAIEELLEHYGAKGHPEEYITVSRIIPSYQVAAPVWNVSKKTA